MYVYILLIVASFFAGWKTDSWYQDSLERVAMQEQIAAMQGKHITDIRRVDNVIEAQNKSAKRAVVLRDEAAASRDALVRLSVASDQAIRAAGLSKDACLNTATTATKLLQNCADRYRGLGEVADRHVNDLQTLGESWPKSE